MEIDDLVEVRRLRNQRLSRRLLEDCSPAGPTQEQRRTAPRNENRGIAGGLGIAGGIVVVFALVGFIAAGGLHSLSASHSVNRDSPANASSSMSGAADSSPLARPGASSENGPGSGTAAPRVPWLANAFQVPTGVSVTTTGAATGVAGQVAGSSLGTAPSTGGARAGLPGPATAKQVSPRSVATGGSTPFRGGPARVPALQQAIACPSGADSTDCAAIASLDRLSDESPVQISSDESTFVDDLRALTITRSASSSLVNAALSARQDFDALRSVGSASSVQAAGLRSAFHSDVQNLATAAAGPHDGTPPPMSVSMADLQAWEGHDPAELASSGAPILRNDVYSLAATVGAPTAMVGAARQLQADFAVLQNAERSSGGATTGAVRQAVSTLAVDVQNLGTASQAGQ